MEQRTPKAKKFSLSSKFKGINEYGESSIKKSANDIEKTPTQRKLSLSQRNECSPVFVPCTQEALDQLDVIWDWNSPESSKRQKQPIQKKVHGYQPPKPIKRHVSINDIESYDKLKHELETLKNQLVESQSTNKHVGKTLFPDEVDVNNEFKDLDDLFGDDSLEEEMILQSQKIENLLTIEIKNSVCDIINVQNIVSNNKTVSITPKTELRKVKSDNYLDTTLEDYGLNKKSNSNLKVDDSQSYNMLKCYTDIDNSELYMKDDSFDYAFKSFNDELICQPNCTKGVTMEKSKQKERFNKQEIEQKIVTNTKQVTSSTFSDCNKQEVSNNNTHKQNQKDEVSPIKCSPEEIEQKRLQALAKLQAKKKQEKIERNRREALKRLEINKKKRAMSLQNLYKK